MLNPEIREFNLRWGQGGKKAKIGLNHSLIHSELRLRTLRIYSASLRLERGDDSGDASIQRHVNRRFFSFLVSL